MTPPSPDAAYRAAEPSHGYTPIARTPDDSGDAGRSTAPSLTIGVLQHACPTDHTPEQNRDTAAHLARQAVDQGAQLVVTQELFDGPYFPQHEAAPHFDFAEPLHLTPDPSGTFGGFHTDTAPAGSRTRFLADLARELGVHLSASCFERRTAGLYHNTSLLFGPDGRVRPGGLYRKMHIPDDPRFYEKYYFSPGSSTPAPAPAPGRGPQPAGESSDQDPTPREAAQLGWSVADLPLGPSTCRVSQLVCWDQWFPEAARVQALLGAQLILYPTAIAWHAEEADDENQRQRDTWITMQRSHAIANGLFVAAINRTGVEHDLRFWGSSFIADPQGTVLAEAPVDEPAALVATLDLGRIEPHRRAWPFLRDRRIDAYGPLLRRFLD